MQTELEMKSLRDENPERLHSSHALFWNGMNENDGESC
jgi:hypothetical protein